MVALSESSGESAKLHFALRGLTLAGYVLQVEREFLVSGVSDGAIEKGNLGFQ